MAWSSLPMTPEKIIQRGQITRYRWPIHIQIVQNHRTHWLNILSEKFLWTAKNYLKNLISATAENKYGKIVNCLDNHLNSWKKRIKICNVTLNKSCKTKTSMSFHRIIYRIDFFPLFIERDKISTIPYASAHLLSNNDIAIDTDLISTITKQQKQLSDSNTIVRFPYGNRETNYQ